jgi:hypothetical protein
VNEEKSCTLSFEIENYNPNLELIIDPVTRLWGTYYGGSGSGGDLGYSCSTDASGNVYLAGYTSSNTGTIIATAGSHQSTNGGGTSDAFLVKFNLSGVRQWGTYYGGAGDDLGYSCATAGAGNVYLAGYTASNTGTILATAGSHQSTYGGGTYDAFFLKFNTSGLRLWGTYYGGQEMILVIPAPPMAQAMCIWQGTHLQTPAQSSLQPALISQPMVVVHLMPFW